MLLVVTDDSVLGEFISEELNHLGVPALALTSGSVLSFLDRSERHVVLLEESGVIGHDLCRRLIDRYPDLPVVQLGQGRGLEDMRDAYAAGVCVVLPRRPELGNLITVLNRLRADAATNGRAGTGSGLSPA